MLSKTSKPLLLAACLAVLASAQGSVETVSARFLGTPYMDSPLGEGDAAMPGVKASVGPRYRLDGFDCLTFVETVLAVARYGEGAAGSGLDRIRYKGGRASFLNRNHFISLDWMPNNASVLRDATERVSQALLSRPAKIHTTRIDKQRWFKTVHGIDVETPVVESRVAYIPIADLLANKEKIASVVDRPMIVSTVARYRRQGNYNDITHIGFLVPKDGRLVFRHASNRQGKVADSEFFRYLNFLSGNVDNLGLNFVDVVL
jgi:hypothetical protein